ncbi:MAG: hypothetical protein M3451_01820 [Chloroflexota bacterium]|nr:hypothetical protein [Chloroflexota bacterium]
MTSENLLVVPHRIMGVPSVSIRSSYRMPMPILALMVAVLIAFTMVSAVRAQNVDWMTADQAATLDLSFNVMVPNGIPAPFAGSPSMSASSGYYSLYWVNYGGAPTFLQITGEVGGSLPAGSPADLNQQLSINASVQGYEAIHDVTSIYDNVWWIAGGVLYTVSSNNMQSTDSLSLADSLIALQPPVQQELVPVVTPTPRPPAPTTAPQPEGQVDSGAGGGVVAAAPGTDPQPEGQVDSGGGGGVVAAVPGTEPVTPASNVADATGGVVDATEPSPEEPTEDGPAPTTTTPDTAAESTSDDDGTGGLASFLEADTVGLVNALAGSVALSDGTAGPSRPTGGDGTGGIRQIAIP